MLFNRRDTLRYILSSVFSSSWLTEKDEGFNRNFYDHGEKAEIRHYNTLGRTGLKVSDIGFGVAVSTDPQLLVDAYRRGINYYDISPFYSWSVEMLEAAFKLDREMKHHAIVASKVECESIFFRFSKEPHKILLECIDHTLKKLGRTHIDILQLHSLGENGQSDLEWLDADTKKGSEALKLFEILKRQGKVRFLGVSSHGPHLLDTVIEKTIKSGQYDMIMPALNFMQTPILQTQLKEAKEKGVGVIAMKVLANARHLKVNTLPGRPFSHAAIAWALQQPGVNGLVITIQNWEQLDEYLGASGYQLSLFDSIRLSLFKRVTCREYCRVGCYNCEGSCPNIVDIASILRFDQYRSDYGLAGFARERYAALPQNRRPAVCLTCKTISCEGACPFGISIKPRLLNAYLHLDCVGVQPF